MNVLLDALKLSRYTTFVTENFKLPANIKQSLDFCDYADTNGFEIAYQKYKQYLKIDTSKQQSLF